MARWTRASAVEARLSAAEAGAASTLIIDLPLAPLGVVPLDVSIISPLYLRPLESMNYISIISPLYLHYISINLYNAAIASPLLLRRRRRRRRLLLFMSSSSSSPSSVGIVVIVAVIRPRSSSSSVSVRRRHRRRRHRRPSSRRRRPRPRPRDAAAAAAVVAVVAAAALVAAPRNFGRPPPEPAGCYQCSSKSVSQRIQTSSYSQKL